MSGYIPEILDFFDVILNHVSDFFITFTYKQKHHFSFIQSINQYNTFCIAHVHKSQFDIFIMDYIDLICRMNRS